MTRSPAHPLPPPRERRRLREAGSLTRAQLAERVGVRPDTVRAWESGRSTPRGRNRKAYAELLAGLKATADGGREAVAVAGLKATADGGTEAVAVAGLKATADGGTATDAVAVTGAAAERVGRQVREAATVVTVRPEGTGSGGADGAVAPDPEAFVLEPPGTGPLLDRQAPSWARSAAGCEAFPYLTPAQAFDALYAYCAPALVRQAYLLTGRRDLAHESVERAFQRAWDHWPEVARDPDPAGWVRAAAHEWALSPWHRLCRRYRHPEPPPPEEDDRTLLDGLLSLPPPYRRTLVLYDGVGLDLPETAAETEASTRAAAGRLMYARETLVARVPELADPRELHHRLAELASTGRLRAAEPSAVRGGSERRARLWTRAATAFTVVLIGATALTLHTAPTHYVPPVPPGETVQGVPPRMAPGPLSDDRRELRDRLREALHHGPERLTPQAR
ncbi:helix-turn-helix domain-containing protein [Streptomyces sp. RO-S4]|uniref:helix-turn-helix domain-containing protein n=1 Tax=Streptomyces sp. RO-S4 TaxID=2902486 RepID=UPI00208E5C39|nr:helix-turn-helix domain-containing protein [Streptomyces sp. RO-S4]MCO4700322.1 helix-turn-helix domain-containing protein [Streptomyces sp. RO-S4]